MKFPYSLPGYHRGKKKTENTFKLHTAVLKRFHVITNIAVVSADLSLINPYDILNIVGGLV